MGCIYEPHRSEIIIETVLGRLPSPGYYTDNRLNYTSSIPKKKKPVYLFCNVNFRGRLQVYHNSRSCKSALREHRLEVTVYAVSLGLSLVHHHQKELIHSSEAPRFAAIGKGIPPDHLVWWPAGSVIMAPQDCMYLYIIAAD